MKKVILMIITILFVVTECTKEKNITFEAQIESLSDHSMMVTTKDDIGFDKASVGLSTTQIEGDLVEGKKVKITIHPEVRETYPVKVTATKIEVMDGAFTKYLRKKLRIG